MTPGEGGRSCCFSWGRARWALSFSSGFETWELSCSCPRSQSKVPRASTAPGASLRRGMAAAAIVPLRARMDPVLLPAFLVVAVAARARHGRGQAGLGLQGHIRHCGHRELPAHGVSWHSPCSMGLGTLRCHRSSRRCHQRRAVPGWHGARRKGCRVPACTVRTPSCSSQGMGTALPLPQAGRERLCKRGG